MINKSNIKWGLIIQGPILSFGQGGNNNIKGFDATHTINENIRNFEQIVDYIVFSTWENSGFSLNYNFLKNYSLIENKLPKGKDPDNRKKQFHSTFAGLEFLKKNTNITHVLKIRTDQLIPVAIIDWLTNLFNDNDKEGQNYNIKNKLVFSEFIESEYFYVGDFIFAGEFNNLYNFVDINLQASKNIHPSIGIDYFLKYLKKYDINMFNKHFLSRLPLIFQVSMRNNKSIFNYWQVQLIEKCTFLPRFIANEIIWRGVKMEDLKFHHFCYFEEWKEILLKKNQIVLIQKKINVIDFINIDKFYIKKLKYEFTRYYKLRIKFYLPNLYSVIYKMFK